MAINRVTLMGNLTRDASLRTTGKGTDVLDFGLAVNEKHKDESGKVIESTLFIECVVFGTRAARLEPFLTKGRKVTVDGKLRYRTWMKDDEKRSAISVLVTDLGFVDWRGGANKAQEEMSAGTDLYDADIPF